MTQEKILYHTDFLQLIFKVLRIFFTLIHVLIRNILRTFFQAPKCLKGRVCVVTGSGRGLGRALCLHLGQEGCTLACLDINEENNRRTVEELEARGIRAKAYRINVADREEVAEGLKRIERDLGEIYLLVNNAGLILPSQSPSEDYLRAVFSVNSIAPIWTCRAVLPGMRARNQGHIVNISSISGLYGTPVLSIYSASKAALTNFSESLRLEVNSFPNNQIKVTCVHPHVINTSEDYLEMINTRVPAVETEGAAEAVVRAILYDRTDISYPAYFYWLFAFARLLPSEVIERFVRLLDVKSSLPTQEVWKELEVSDEVKVAAADKEHTSRKPSGTDQHDEELKEDTPMTRTANGGSPGFTIRSLRESSTERLRQSIRSLRNQQQQPPSQTPLRTAIVSADDDPS